MSILHPRRILLVILLCVVSGCALVPPVAAPVVPPPTSATGANNTTIVAIAPPAGPVGTIWDFLGVKALCRELGIVIGCGLDLLGSRFPGLAPGLPMSSLSNPANLQSSNPAVAAAAAVKADENAAPQKVAALRFLGSIGCGGCYPEVEKALLAGLDDCTEVVRFEAASALAETSRNQCRFCSSSKCCSPAVRKKLMKIAIETNDSGCFFEPSARVRRMARVALCNCSGEQIDSEPTILPTEGPSPEVPLPPSPDPSIGLETVRPRQSTSPIEIVESAENGLPIDARMESERSTITLMSANASGVRRSKETASEYAGSPGMNPRMAVNQDFSARNSRIVKSQDVIASPPVTGPRIRWEQAEVIIFRFETKQAAFTAMDFIRRKAVGEDLQAPNDPNLKYVTTREFGWTRLQDMKSRELAKQLSNLRVGEFSPVLMIGDSLIVCRVLEREFTSDNRN
jgi:hypothetical protein